jgi:hypothetical protein
MHTSWIIEQVWTALRLLIKICDYLNLSTERAIAIDIAWGRPSGIETIRIHKAMITNFVMSKIVP